MYTYTHAPLARVIIKDTYPEDIKMLQCVGAIEFSRFRIAKNKAPFNAFIMSGNYPPERHNPKAWANYECKDTIIFGEMQENGEKIAIFCLEDAAEPLGFMA